MIVLLADEDEERVIFECSLILLAINSIVGEEEAAGCGNGDASGEDQVVVGHSCDCVYGDCSVGEADACGQEQ